MTDNILQIIAERFKQEGTVRLTESDFKQILKILNNATHPYTKLFEQIVSLLTHKIPVDFNTLVLERRSCFILNDNKQVETISPLMLTLKKFDQVVFIMEGGYTGIIDQDIISLLDTLLTMNLIKFSTTPMIDIGLFINVPGYRC